MDAWPDGAQFGNYAVSRVQLCYMLNYFSNAIRMAVHPRYRQLQRLAVENAFYYVPDLKVLHETSDWIFCLHPQLAPDVDPKSGHPQSQHRRGGGGLADLWVQPMGLASEASGPPGGRSNVASHRRYTPGASNNVGTGYSATILYQGETVYITKKAPVRISSLTGRFTEPGRAPTGRPSRWSGVLGKFFVEKEFQPTAAGRPRGIRPVGEANSKNGGTVPIGSTNLTIPASTLPYYSVHAIGGQGTYILPMKVSVFTSRVITSTPPTLSEPPLCLAAGTLRIESRRLPNF